MSSRLVEDALQLLRSEYLEMTTPTLTPSEVARLLDIDPVTARLVLQALEDSGFLERTRDGRFARAAHPG